MSSSSAGADSLVARLWSAWFEQLRVAIADNVASGLSGGSRSGSGSGSGSTMVGGLFEVVEQAYTTRNLECCTWCM